jgi:hypothetical protein
MTTNKPRRLSEAHKRFIVQALARGMTPSKVIKAAHETFGLELSSSGVLRYDPTTLQGETLSEELKTLFYAERKKHLEERDNTPAAHIGYRLRVLQEMIDRQLDRKVPNDKLIAELLEQAAKECGGLYSRTGSKGEGNNEPLTIKVVYEDEGAAWS